MNWPRGKYNGRDIVGVSVKVRVYLNRWYWRPRHYEYSWNFHWLCFSVWIEAEYGR